MAVTRERRLGRITGTQNSVFPLSPIVLLPLSEMDQKEDLAVSSALVKLSRLLAVK